MLPVWEPSLEEQGPHQELCLQVSTLPFSSRFSCHDTVCIPEISPAVNDSGAASASPFFGRLKRFRSLESPTVFYSCASSRCTHRSWNECKCWSVVSDSLRPHELKPARLLCPLRSPGKNIGVGCHSLLQGNLPDPGTESVSTALPAECLSSEPQGHCRCKETTAGITQGMQKIHK